VAFLGFPQDQHLIYQPFRRRMFSGDAEVDRFVIQKSRNFQIQHDLTFRDCFFAHGHRNPIQRVSPDEACATERQE
jgi:hypothetical protein